MPPKRGGEHSLTEPALLVDDTQMRLQVICSYISNAHNSRKKRGGNARTIQAQLPRERLLAKPAHKSARILPALFTSNVSRGSRHAGLHALLEELSAARRRRGDDAPDFFDVECLLVGMVPYAFVDVVHVDVR